MSASDQPIFARWWGFTTYEAELRAYRRRRVMPWLLLAASVTLNLFLIAR